VPFYAGWTHEVIACIHLAPRILAIYSLLLLVQTWWHLLLVSVLAILLVGLIGLVTSIDFVYIAPALSAGLSALTGAFSPGLPMPFSP
jgi:hypothetical protein